MSAYKLLKHLLLPHESNNRKAKFIHTSTLWLLVLFIAGFQLVLNSLPAKLPSVLGYAASISPTEVVKLTNDQRAAAGLSPLTENKSLSNAALAKGQDMLSKGYWAHFAPDGTTPWSFFLNFGYKYQFAGENLARDFSNAQGAVSAWMNSATHKENILNPKYKEIGIGVVEGNLSGVDTTIIVQFFGSPLIGAPNIPIARAATNAPSINSAPTFRPSPKPQITASPSPTVQPTLAPTLTPTPAWIYAESSSGSPVYIASSNTGKPKISPFATTRGMGLIVTAVVLIVLAIDLIIVRRQRIVRIGGRTLAHLAYLSMVLAVLLILKAGQII
jgi:hypothetical protein